MSLQAAYANLYATVQGLLSRTEKSVADLTDFNRMRAEFDEWFARANGTAQDAAQGSAKGAIKDRVDQGHDSIALFHCPIFSSGMQVHTCIIFILDKEVLANKQTKSPLIVEILPVSKI